MDRGYETAPRMTMGAAAIWRAMPSRGTYRLVFVTGAYLDLMRRNEHLSGDLYHV